MTDFNVKLVSFLRGVMTNKEVAKDDPLRWEVFLIDEATPRSDPVKSASILYPMIKE